MLKVKEVMTTNVTTIGGNANIAKILRAPLLQENCLGIIPLSDLLSTD